MCNLRVEMTFCYSVYSLKLSSDISFPDLETVEFENPDVIIRQQSIPSIGESGIEINEKGVLLETDEIRMRITEGRFITYEPVSTTGAPAVRSYLVASGLGAILQQRGFLVLHASAVNHQGKAIMFCGDSGMGKSNTAASLLQQQHALLADDMCPIFFESVHPYLLTSFMNLKLTESDIEENSLTDFRSLDWEDTKDKHRLIADYQNQPPSIPVKALFFLEPARNNKVEIEPVTGAQCIYYLIKNTFRYQFTAGTQKVVSDLQMHSRLAERVKAYVLSRPLGLNTRVEVRRLVLERLSLDWKESDKTV